jgi:hypothetical protein
VEKHLTLSREEEGPDSDFSLEPDELVRWCGQCAKRKRHLGRCVTGRPKKNPIAVFFGVPSLLSKTWRRENSSPRRMCGVFGPGVDFILGTSAMYLEETHHSKLTGGGHWNGPSWDN